MRSLHSSVTLFASLIALAGCGVPDDSDARKASSDAAVPATVTKTETKTVAGTGTETVTKTVTVTDTGTSTSTGASTGNDAGTGTDTGTSTSTGTSTDTATKSDAGTQDIKCDMSQGTLNALHSICPNGTLICNGTAWGFVDPTKCPSASSDAGAMPDAQATDAPVGVCVNGRKQEIGIAVSGVPCTMTQICTGGTWVNEHLICNLPTPDASPGPEVQPDVQPDVQPAADVLTDTAPECVAGDFKVCPNPVNGSTYAVFCVNGSFPTCPTAAIDGGTLDTQAMDTQSLDAQKADTTPDTLSPDTVETGTDAVPDSTADGSIACQAGSADVACTLTGCDGFAVRHCANGKLMACTCVHANWPGPAIMDCQKDSLGKYTFTLWGVNATGLEGSIGLEGGFFHREYGIPTRLCLAGSHNNWARTGAACDTSTAWAPLQTYQFTEASVMAGKVINPVGLTAVGQERWGDEDPYVSRAQADAENKATNLGTIMPAGICSLTSGGLLVNQ